MIWFPRWVIWLGKLFDLLLRPITLLLSLWDGLRERVEEKK